MGTHDSILDLKERRSVGASTRLGSEGFSIEAGDVIFVPAGTDHKIFVQQGDELEVLEFLDKPGLDEEFRIWHRRFADRPGAVTLDEVNAVARKYGTIYKTLE